MTHGTINIDTKGVAYMPSRVFFLHAAIEEFQTNGFLTQFTLDCLTHDEYLFVMDRANHKGAR